MRRSIRTFLLINLLISVTLVTCLSIIGNLYIDHKNIRAQLDARLPIQAFTIRALVTHDLASRDFADLQQQIREIPRLTDHFFDKIPNKRLSDFYGPVEVQVWNQRGQILLRTQNAPPIRLAGNTEGFADKWINKRHWRVFTTIDPHTQLVIAVAQRYNFRDQLETRITRDTLIMMLLTYPILGILIWFIVGRGLHSIRLVAKAPNSQTC